MSNNRSKIEDAAKGSLLAGRIRRIGSHVFVILWMIFIFYMSAQPGDTSGEISGSVSHLFMQIWNAVFGLDWSEVEILQMAQAWDYPIRKMAHMTEFGILAVLVYWALGCYESFTSGEKVGRLLHFHRRYLAAAAVAIVYAATDEIHQLFVPDRVGAVTDVLIDSCGVVIALCCIWGCTSLGKRIIFWKNKRLSAKHK